MPSTTITSASNSSLNTTQVTRPTNSDPNKSVSKLSTGSRINSASDDAAGLRIAERLKAEARERAAQEGATFTANSGANRLAGYAGKVAQSNADRDNSVRRLDTGSGFNSSSEDTQGIGVAERGRTETEQRDESGDTSSSGGGVPNRDGAPSDGNRGQAIERYRTNSTSDPSNPSGTSVRG